MEHRKDSAVIASVLNELLIPRETLVLPAYGTVSKTVHVEFSSLPKRVQPRDDELVVAV